MGRRALEASSSEKLFCENKTVIIENIFRVSLIQNQREEHMLHLASEVRKIWRCSCWEKGDFILISEFQNGQTLTISTYFITLHTLNTNNLQSTYY